MSRDADDIEAEIEALAALAGSCPDDRLAWASCRLDEACVAWPGSDQLIYARGLTLWRRGQAAAALDAWSGLSPAAQDRLSGQLDAARLKHAVDLSARGLLGEAAIAADGVRDPDAPLAVQVRHALALAAAKAGAPMLARRVCQGSHGDAPAIRALAALLDPDPPGRLARLLDLPAEIPREVRRAAVRAAAAAAVQTGRADLLPTLAQDSPDDLDVQALLELSSAGETAGVFRSPAFTRSSEAFAVLMGAPDPDAPAQAQASFWIAEGRHEAAANVLARQCDVWDPATARTLAALGLTRALRSEDEIDLGAWRDAIAAVTAFLENERWLGAWVIERLAVYELSDDYRTHAAGLKSALEQLLDRRLARMSAKAQLDEDHDRAATLAGLITELARERRAAAAVWKSEALRVADERVAAGPMFISRFGQVELMRDTFVELNGAPSDERSTLSDIMQRLEMDSAGHEHLLPEPEETPAIACRCWFSELGEAAALQATGDLLGARAAAMDVFVRWSPPDHPADMGIDERNMGYAGLADPMSTLRADAARIVVNSSLASLEDTLSAADFDPEGLASRLRATLGEAVGLHCEARTRRRLTSMILGRHQLYMEDGSPEALAADAAMLRQAHQADIEGLSRARSIALNHLCDVLLRQDRYAEGVRFAEEAWRVEPEIAALAENWVAALLRRFEQVRATRGLGAARQILDEADAAIDTILEERPGLGSMMALRRAVRSLRTGAALSDVLQFNEGNASLPLVDGAASAATSALERAEAAARETDMDAMAEAIDAALEADDGHPVVVAKAISLLDDQATSIDTGLGRRLFNRLDLAARKAGRRHPTHLPLVHARGEMEGLRRLFHADGPVQLLHRKAILLYRAGNYRSAADLMETVVALAPRREAEALVFLAECLIAWLSTAELDDETRDTKRDLIDQVLALATRFSAGHPRVQAAKEAAAGLDETLGP